LCAQKAPATPDQESKPMVRFYPNPAINFITFDIKESVERGTTILVYSFLGRQIAAIPVNSQRVTVNISEYYRGIYVFQLRSPSGKVLETNKFQVNR
jgi:zona occludens toxin (predicted ATPase)